MNPLLKNILIAVVALALLFAIYKFFFASEPEAPLSSQPVSGLSTENGDLLSLLVELKSISLSEVLLADPAFITLQDFTVELTPEPIGRRNPFAPIGSEPSAPEEPVSTTTPVTP